MNMMQFRDYVFKNNPERISVRGKTVLAEFFCPGAGGFSQNLGEKPAEVKCEGCFTGENASAALAEAGEFRRRCHGQAGVLHIPGMEPIYARLGEIALDLSGDGRIIPYTVLFIEAEEQ